MRTAYDVAAVRAAEADLMATVPEPDLMQIAARGLAGICAAVLRSSGGVTGRQVVLLVGSGNNGGDALFAGSFLARRGAAVTALCLSEQVHGAGLAALRRAGGKVRSVTQEPEEARRVATAAELVVDGIVGIGASGPLRPVAAALVRAADGAFVVAADIPSGIDPSTGAVPDPAAAVRADVTVTFGALKAGLLLPPGRDHAGVVELVDIGLGQALRGRQALCEALTLDDAAPFLAAPGAADYKYSHGVVGVVAGSDQYPGAPHMVVGAARHAGAGMVRLWRDASPAVAAAVVTRYPDVVTTTGSPAADEKSTAWAIGPGMGTGAAARDTVAKTLGSAVPVVVDADALTVIASDQELRELLRARAAVTVITPHVGEFRRLGLELTADRLASARAAAQDLGAVVVLKGPGTVVADPDGTPFVDEFGPAALATAGTGDALTGLIGAVLSRQPADPGRAVAAAVAVHGLAARLASRDGRPMTSWDLVEAVPDAVVAVRGG